MRLATCEDYPDVGGVGLKKRKKKPVGPALVFIFLCFLTADCVSSCLKLWLPRSLHHRRLCILELHAKISLSLLSCFCQVFYHNNKKSGWDF